MTAVARPGRARRGRVMIVGNGPELASLAPLLQSSSDGPILANNLFEALGEVTIAPPGAPITTVLIENECLESSTSHIIEALRKIDPSLRLVLMAPSGSISAPAWLAKGVDDCIESPIRPADLTRLCEEEAAGPGPSPAKASRPQESASDSLVADQSAAEVEPAQGISLDDLRRKLDATDELIAEITLESAVTEPESTSNIAPAPPSDSPVPHSSQSPPTSGAPQPAQSHSIRLTQDLGDTDLVEAILCSTALLQERALKLVAQQTGWSDVLLLDENTSAAIAQQPPISTPPSPAHTAIVEVTFDNHSFGRLATSLATSDQLQPWADWLARWLTLDRTFRDYQLKALQDDLTGAWNRRFFDAFLTESIARASKARRPVTIMVFDIDNFKPYNDQFGHEAGDEVLREIVHLLTSVIRQGDRVCRIGGDEFAVIFADPEAPRKPTSAGGGVHPESIELIAKRFQDQVCSMRFPKLGPQALGTLSISAGLATYPWDGLESAALLRHADHLALESKRKGKNAITFGPGALRACGPQTH